MDFQQLLAIVGDAPVFETGLLLVGDTNPQTVHRQLSRWVKSGRLLQLRRGLYALAPPYQKVKPHPFLVANALARGSYVSCQSALAYYGLIPEYVPQVISVTTQRPGRWTTPFGLFLFHHVKAALLEGYQVVPLGSGQQALVALPEKALLDLIYLTPGSDNADYLDGLRLQQLELLNLETLQQLASRLGGPKLQRAAGVIEALAQAEVEEYQSL